MPFYVFSSNDCFHVNKFGFIDEFKPFLCAFMLVNLGWQWVLLMVFIFINSNFDEINIYF